MTKFFAPALLVAALAAPAFADTPLAFTYLSVVVDNTTLHYMAFPYLSAKHSDPAL